MEVGKKYRSTASYKIATCLYVCPNGGAILEWPDKSTGYWYADTLQKFEEVKPEPRTGKAWVKLYDKQAGGGQQIFNNRPIDDNGEVFEIEWKEIR